MATPTGAKASRTYWELRLVGQVLDVDEVVAGLAVGPRVAQAAEVQHAAALPADAPELRLGGQRPGVVQAAGGDRGVLAQNPLVDVDGQRRQRAVAVDPQPAVFVDQVRRPGVLSRAVVGNAGLPGKLAQAKAGLARTYGWPSEISPGCCGAPQPLSHGRFDRSRPRTCRIAAAITRSLVVSFCASQMTTHGWFQRSRIHSVYSTARCSGVISSGQPSWPPVPDGKLVLDQDAFLVGDLVPQFRRETDAVAEAVPVHLLEAAVQLADPFASHGSWPRSASSKKR